MAENSKIEWTDHTFNPWVGCTKVSPGCDHCYAEGWAKRSGLVRWGADRRRTSASNWRQPLKWNAEAAKTGARRRVFCASLADVFDNEVPGEWRSELGALIRATPNLDWLLLTKRIGNVRAMLPEDWGAGYPNVWLGATVVNQEEADRDVPKLLATPAQVRFLSCEPLLGPIDLSPYLVDDVHRMGRAPRMEIDWVIVGGESGPHARPMHPRWAGSLRDQCFRAGVAFHFKQWGEFTDFLHLGERWNSMSYEAQGRQEFVEGRAMIRVGKKVAGRLLDGLTWDEFPQRGAVTVKASQS
jgi:protein gp37